MRIPSIFRAICLLIAVALLPPACGQTIRNKEAGAVIGGVAGGVVGSQIGSGAGKTAATIIGVILGAGLGYYIGGRMDEADKAQMNHTLERNRTGQSTSWTNPDTNTSYEVTPTQTYWPDPNNKQQPCREFESQVFIDGKPETAYGRACRQPDGRWEIIQYDSRS